MLEGEPTVDRIHPEGMKDTIEKRQTETGICLGEEGGDNTLDLSYPTAPAVSMDLKATQETWQTEDFKSVTVPAVAPSMIPSNERRISDRKAINRLYQEVHSLSILVQAMEAADDAFFESFTKRLDKISIKIKENSLRIAKTS